MNPLGLLPLVVALLVVSVAPLATVNPRLDTHLTRIARRYFSRYVPPDAPDRKRRLRSAYVDETYRSYAAKTYLVTALTAVGGAIVGVYLAGGLLLVLPAVGEFIQQLPDAIANTLGRPELEPKLGERGVFLVVTAGGVVTGLAVAGLTYWYRWAAPGNRSEVRRRGINEGLPRTVAFAYALSRGGMATPAVLRTLAANRRVYGHGADELSVAVREMDLFGRDVVSAVRHVAERTPSDKFRTFAENLASVLQSGQNRAEFLRDQYERYRDEAQDRQDEVLELLATIAEAYVTILVAGTLFLMTILLVFGLTFTRTINFLRLLAYLAIPLANLLFVVYLDGKLHLLGVARGSDTGGLRAALGERDVSELGVTRWRSRGNGARDAVDPGSVPDRWDGGSTAARSDGGSTAPGSGDGSTAARSDGGSGATLSDGGATAGTSRSTTGAWRQLALYDRVSRFKRAASDPLRTILWNPTRLLYLTVPLAVLWVAVRFPDAVTAGGIRIRVLDDFLVQAFLVVVGSFAVAWELYARRIRELEASLPEFLHRLASLNHAGMPVVESVDRVRESDLGELSVEVDRIWRDLDYGANLDDALRRFGLRVRTTATTRVVTLLTNALRASGDVAPVLRIAGEQAESELKLRRRRRQQMFTYLVVIYVSFAVFLVIIVAVQEVLVPSLPTNVPVPDPEDTARLGVDARQFARFASVDKAAYTLVFFHTALIQAVLSGFVAGQLGEGSLKAGAKHATVMLGVAYLAFLLMSSPVAQVTFADQTMDGDAVVVESVSMSQGGFVAVHAISPDGDVVGTSRYLEAGRHTDVRIRLQETYAARMQLYASPHLDTDDNRRFGDAGQGSVDAAYSQDGGPVYDVATVRRSSSGPTALETLGSARGVDTHLALPPLARSIESGSTAAAP